MNPFSKLKILSKRIESDLMKVNDFYELRMNKSERKLLFILLSRDSVCIVLI